MKYVAAGKISGTCGLQGELKAVCYLEFPGILSALDKVFLQREGEEIRSVAVRRWEIQRRAVVFALKGIEEVRTARELVGCDILISSEAFPPLPEGEYYWHDILGVKVIGEDGRILGTVVEIFPTGGNDVYVCRGGGEEILLPATAEVVRSIDSAAGVMVVRLPEGLRNP